MLRDVIIQGDCLEVMQSLEDCSVDMVLCDLPYGTTACKWDVVIPFEPLWKQYKRVIKPNGAIVLTGTQPFTSLLVTSNLPMFKCVWVWEKTKATNYVKANQMPMKYHEDVVVFGNGKVTYNPQMVKGEPYRKVAVSRAKEGTVFVDTRSPGDVHVNNGERFPSSIQLFPNGNNGSLHPTQKPVALFEYLIRTYTNEGDLVLDNCAGSCTTAVAAINSGRHWICIELDERYCGIGRRRVAEQAGEVSL